MDEEEEDGVENVRDIFWRVALTERCHLLSRGHRLTSNTQPIGNKGALRNVAQTHNTNHSLKIRVAIKNRRDRLSVFGFRIKFSSFHTERVSEWSEGSLKQFVIKSSRD